MTPEQAVALRKPFPASSIGKLPKGGMMLDYVGHAATTDRLLQVDPGWSWEPFALDEHGLPLLDRSGNLWIRLTVCGVTRIGVGDGKSAKEVVGDAIRNGAMRFGVALDLWAKEDLEGFAAAAGPPPDDTPPSGEPVTRRMRRPITDVPIAPPELEPVKNGNTSAVTPEQLRKIGACMTDLKLTVRSVALTYVRDAVGREDIESRNDLSKLEGSRLIDALEKDLQAKAERDHAEDA